MARSSSTPRTGDSDYVSGRQVRTVDDLLAVLGHLTDQKRREFARWADPRALLAFPQVVGTRAANEAATRAWRSFERLGDGSLSSEDVDALERDPVDEAMWQAAAEVIYEMAKALTDQRQPALRVLEPALRWLETAATRAVSDHQEPVL